jgi:hypothetical protein
MLGSIAAGEPGTDADAVLFRLQDDPIPPQTAGSSASETPAFPPTGDSISLYTRFAELTRTGMDPAARQVLAAVRDDELYVFTHPERRGAVEERFRAILAAFDRAAEPS